MGLGNPNHRESKDREADDREDHPKQESSDSERIEHG